MILTITLNPAIDKTVVIEDFSPDSVNRIKEIHMEVGGKGLNVSTMIHAMGEKSKALAILGGASGDYIKTSLKRQNIEFEFIEVDDETRTNIKIVDPVKHQHTDINEPGPTVDLAFGEVIKAFLKERITSGDIVVISGSSLPGLEVNFYEKLVKCAEDSGARVVLDIDGDRLVHALHASPDVIKPNIHELEGLAGKTFNGISDIVSYCRQMIEVGELKLGALVSLGDQGSLWVTRHEALKAEAIKAVVKTTVGAGDSMVAALAIGMEKGIKSEAILKMATAAAWMRITSERNEKLDSSNLEEVIQRVIVKRLD